MLPSPNAFVIDEMAESRSLCLASVALDDSGCLSDFSEVLVSVGDDLSVEFLGGI